MDRTSRYARCGEPDDATSIKSGSAGGWEKRPKGPRSQPTQLQSSRSTFSWGSFPSLFAFQEGMWDTQISPMGDSPTVSLRFFPQLDRLPAVRCFLYACYGSPRRVQNLITRILSTLRRPQPVDVASVLLICDACETGGDARDSAGAVLFGVCPKLCVSQPLFTGSRIGLKILV